MQPGVHLSRCGGALPCSAPPLHGHWMWSDCRLRGEPQATPVRGHRASPAAEGSRPSPGAVCAPRRPAAPPTPCLARQADRRRPADGPAGRWAGGRAVTCGSRVSLLLARSFARSLSLSLSPLCGVGEGGDRPAPGRNRGSLVSLPLSLQRPQGCHGTHSATAVGLTLCAHSRVAQRAQAAPGPGPVCVCVRIRV